MVVAEGAALITSIKGTIDIVKGLKSSYDANAIMKAQADILEQLFAIRMDAIALQEKHLALSNEKEELIKKLMQFEQCEKTESEYELKEIVRGKFVYSRKNSQQPKIPTHWLCTQCWDDRKKSILQANYHNKEEARYTCPRCKFGIDFYVSELLQP